LVSNTVADLFVIMVIVAVLVTGPEGERILRIRVYLHVVHSAPLHEELLQQVHQMDELQQLRTNLHPDLDSHVCGLVWCFVVGVDTVGGDVCRGDATTPQATPWTSPPAATPRPHQNMHSEELQVHSKVSRFCR
jgi:hypothetical protein